MSTAIEFNHVGKQYRLGLVSTRTLSHDLDRWWKTAVLKKEDPYLKIGAVNDRSKAANGEEYVWALRDIDFKVEQGDVVGIIGKNGAGKSTLLKLLSKVTGPTVGTIHARGRIGALLEVGTGFHPEMTGRENIYMNGAILGMNKSEITGKLDEIVDFSGCERYIDTPVKRYSSGMKVRLGFAVAAHLDPEILVVDEVLAVGDAECQKKAIGKMQDVSRGEGRTVLFVSHNMASIRALCKNGILLENGQIAFQGPVGETVDHYLLSNKGPEDIVSTEGIFKIRNRDISVTSVKVNGIPTAKCELNYPSKTIDIEVDGFIKGHHFLDLEVTFHNLDGFLYARHAPGLFTGKSLEVRDGEFHLHNHIVLPDGIANGQYLINIDITHPQVQTFASTQFPIQLTTRGNFTDNGFTINRNFYGFCCLK